MEFPYIQFEISPTKNSKRKKKIFRPIIPVILTCNSKVIKFAALIDSGADYNLFHGDIAAYLGISKLSSGKSRKITGISGGSIKGYEHNIGIKIGRYSSKSKIIFSNQIPDNATAVLGNIGFFNNYVVTLNYSQKKIKVLNK